jgi:hypothetical protein
VNDATTGKPPEETVAEPKAEETPAAIDPAEFTRLQGIEAEHKKMGGFVEALRGAGITTAEDLTTNLSLIKSMKQGGGDFQKVLEGLLKGEKPPQPKKEAKDAATAGLTAEDVTKLVTEALEKRDQAAKETVYNESLTSEEKLKEKVFEDSRFAKLFMKDGKRVTFADAWAGEAGPVARALAVFADHEFYERGTKNSSGAYQPVTDPSAVKEVADSVAAMYKNLRAATVLEASAEPNDADTGAGSPEDVSTTTVAGSPFGSEAERDAFDSEVSKTVQRVARQIGAQRTGQPASRGV